MYFILSHMTALNKGMHVGPGMVVAAAVSHEDRQ
jgi:hypothetical protein